MLGYQRSQERLVQRAYPKRSQQPALAIGEPLGREDIGHYRPALAVVVVDIAHFKQSSDLAQAGEFRRQCRMAMKELQVDAGTWQQMAQELAHPTKHLLACGLRGQREIRAAGAPGV